VGFLEILHDAFSSGFDNTFLFFLDFCFQSSQLGLLLLDVAALRDFKTSVGGTRGIPR
jgi:hypothetical protein